MAEHVRQPYGWPRLMTLATAAAYLEMTPEAFLREVAAAALPAPIQLGGKERWDRAAIDSLLDQRDGERADDWRLHQPGLQPPEPAVDEAQPKIFTPATLAAHWGVTTSAIYALVRSGDLPHFKLGTKLIRIRADRAEDYAKAHLA